MDLINDGEPFRSGDAAGLGLTRYRCERLVRTGSLRRVVRGVLVDGGVPDSRELRARALALVLPPDAIVSDHSAAWIYGVDTFPPGEFREIRPHCLVRHGKGRPAATRAIVRQTTVPDPDVVLIGGIPVTSPLRTCVDLLRLQWRPYALAAGDAMVRSGVVTPEDVAVSVSQLRRLPGTKQAMELAPRLNPLAESHGESWMRCRILDAGLPNPELQVPMVVDGVERRLDSYFRSQRVAAEYDGRENHTDRHDVAFDDERRAAISRRHSVAFVVATRERIFGEDDSFERELGEKLGCAVRPREW
ncbi:type IV toxin-antitoxin system AbiEi family antitoxin domain-containing protein [Serinibacter salmoneus]|uniref:Transcriptional regulator, AbiEi antitoxin, Type IV TA system n=1 Tax=Serinibacter salmoneus TaxID=556530 RepID=A0A2A9D1Y5_9MICO|nr:type IV toxin-antitoxin system AbiEi family antitoxin domain-containing protein [Serinibacter salmoneus]PFG20684.1 Transcriptional regulator, AbiEi antitoxin, Type IV TA system [Serinibacter salmoneus]